MRRFISELFYKSPDRIIEWIGLLGILLFWLQGYSSSDGISAAIPKLITNLFNWHWDTIYFIKVDTMPHLITSILYWLVFCTIVWLLVKLVQKAKRGEEPEVKKAISQISNDIADLRQGNESMLKHINELIVTMRGLVVELKNKESNKIDPTKPGESNQ